MGDLRRLGTALRELAGDGAGVGVVRVLDRHGFGTVESGQLVVGAPDGLAGELYRGALDDTALPLARSAARAPSTVDAHVSEPAAAAAGLACAGGATLLGHPLPAGHASVLGVALEAAEPAALVSTVDGAAALVLTGPDLGTVTGTLGSTVRDAAAAAAAARGSLRRGATTTELVPTEAGELLLDLWIPVPRVLVVGGGAIASALLGQAELLGWDGGAVTDVEAAVDAVARFGAADVLVLLDHDPGFDAALLAGLRHGRGFLGALGSRRTQAARRERLLAAGVTGAELARIHGPVGLDLGARTPAETAVSVVAQVIAERGARTGAPLADAAGRIGG